MFETKKVPIETLSEYLAEVRGHLGLSVDQVAEKTGIAHKFLEALESAKFQQLPPDVYVFGFLRKLADAYAVPSDQLIKQYKKEKGIVEQVAARDGQEKTGIRGYISKIVITPKLLTLVLGLGAVLGSLIYLTASVAAIDKAPALEIFEPLTGTIVNDSSIRVVGKTDPGSSVAINGQDVFVDSEGKFSSTLGAVAGQQPLDIKAKNKFDKEISRQLVVVVQPDGQAGQVAGTTSGQGQPLVLELSYIQNASVTVTVDDQVQAEKKVVRNSSEKITAQRKIIVTTTDAGAVKATLNGVDLGALGRSKESLTIPFTADLLAQLPQATAIPSNGPNGQAVN